MKPHAIHQFHSGSAYGDGITNGMFFIRDILRESGYRSEIYCAYIEPRLSNEIFPVDDYVDNADNLLLVHYSLGTHHDQFLTELSSRKVLIYHNITPDHFFEEGSDKRVLSRSGRLQLAQWARQRQFCGVIADSEFNAKELRDWGYSAISTIGLLVDLGRLRAHAWHSNAIAQISNMRNLLFVGRLCEHKGQIELVRMMRYLSTMTDLPVRLLLAGGSDSEIYERDLRNCIDQLDLAGHVELLGKLDNEALYGLYRTSDLYVSMSKHEGFGMPLVESMVFDLPVLAQAVGSVRETLGSGGLVLENASPPLMAAAAKLLLHEPSLRRRVIEGQRQVLTCYERTALVNAFEEFLRKIDFDIDFTPAHRSVLPVRQRWRLEGPFDSSYSLALVNRELSRALNRAGEAVGLVSRDGPGTYAPSASFLQANRDIASMVECASDGELADICLRNQFPPSVIGMQGTVRVLANYAWEESGFPEEWVKSFNDSLDLITVTSRYVAKVLRDNGVQVPVAVVGNGVDHIFAGRNVPSTERDDTRPFRFLHISSGFPRKSLDVLLAAWGAAFTKADPVELIIKTFANTHNQVGGQLSDFQTGSPDSAPIRLIEADLPASELLKLYEQADAIVCPSRGEGFGLPIAEAMALGKPVITTGHGGQTDFCTDATAWLCDYSFAYAKTHLSTLGSVWAEPDRGSLIERLREVFTATSEARSPRVEAGRTRILTHYTWDQVAQRTRDVIAEVRRGSTADLHLPSIGQISSWNYRCGIAAYAQSLVSGIDPARLHVFADRVARTLVPDEHFVCRCWNQGSLDPLDELLQSICAARVDVVLIQFNFGFFRLSTLAWLIDRLHEKGKVVFVVLHSTEDLVRPDLTIRLAEIRETLSEVCRLLVHSVHDLNRLKAMGLVDNVTLFPMGLPQPFVGDRPATRQCLGLDGKTVVASFGYLLPHKGLRELIGAIALLSDRVPNAHLLMLNAIYPVPESEIEQSACQEEIEKLDLQDRVTLVTDFLPESEVVMRLAAADIVVYPYQHTQESASAAVKMGLGSLTPIAVTPLDIFADIATVSYTLPGKTPADIADGLASFFADRECQAATLGERQRAWVAAHSWSKLSARLDGLIRGEWRMKMASCQPKLTAVAEGGPLTRNPG